MAKNDVKNTTQKIKDQAKRTPLKQGMNPGAPERLTVAAPLVTTCILSSSSMVKPKTASHRTNTKQKLKANMMRNTAQPKTHG
jgi:hypothetical protein